MAEADGAGPPDATLHPVVLRGIPTEAYVALHLHTEDLLREFEIIDLGHHSGTARVPREVHEVTRRLLEAYRAERQAAWEQAEAARQAGVDRLDIALEVPVSAADAAEELAGLFAEADALARNGALLTVPVAPDLARLRRWMTEEVVRQLRTGAEPTPFPGD